MVYFFHLTLWILKSRNEHHMRILFSVAQQSGNFLYKRILQLQVIDHELISILTYRKAIHDCIVFTPKLTQELFASRELSQHWEDPRKRNNLFIFFLPTFPFLHTFLANFKTVFFCQILCMQFFVPSTLLPPRDCRKGEHATSPSRVCLARSHVHRATTLREWQEQSVRFSRLDRLGRTQGQ